jgi:class 3 adenylate cyclase
VTGGVERKLTAILCADVYGYSRLMGRDEEATLATFTAHRKIIDSLIGHHGRFVNSAGDSVLAEFASVAEWRRYWIGVDTSCALPLEQSRCQPKAPAIAGPRSAARRSRGVACCRRRRVSR